MRKYSADRVHWSKGCGHSWCTDCRTRRGRNRGNRNQRRAVKTLLGTLRKVI